MYTYTYINSCKVFMIYTSIEFIVVLSGLNFQNSNINFFIKDKPQAHINTHTKVLTHKDYKPLKLSS